MDDADLLQRYAVEGAEDAFRLLVERRFGLVYAVALRQVGGDQHLAHDVAQKVFSELARQATALSRHATLSGWLYRAARFTAIDVVRAETRRRAREQEAQLMRELSHPPVVEPDWQNLRPILDDALSVLKERDRDAILLRVVEERSFAEIGRALQLTENTARMCFDRAVEKLRLRLQRRGITSTVSALTLALAHQATAAVPAGLPALVAGEALVGAKLAGSAVAIGGFSLMSSTKTTGAIAAALAFFAVGIGVNETLATRRTDAAIAQLAPEIAALQARHAALTHALVRPPSTPSVTAIKTLAAPTAPAASSLDAVSADAITRLNQAYEINLRLRTENPEYQQLYDRAGRAGTRLAYTALYRTLALTPAQIETFESIFAKNAGATMDLQGAIKTLGLQPDDPVIKEINDRSHREFHQELRALLGPMGYEKFLQERSLASLRSATRDIAENVALSDTPLTAIQSEQLTSILAQHTPDRDPEQSWELGLVDWSALISDSRTVLSPAQLDALQDLAARARYGAANVRLLNQARRRP